MLKRMMQNVFKGRGSAIEAAMPELEGSFSVLNVGGGNKSIPISKRYDTWNQILLDIAPGPGVDLILDARSLGTLDAEQFDAIYCSHNLEHYYRHDCEKVLAGFRHVLKPEGIAEIRVPDIDAVVRTMIDRTMDIDDVLYTAPGGPITIHDVIYGWRVEIERSGVDFYAHKRGFSVKSLTQSLEAAGFQQIFTVTGHYEIRRACV